MTDIATGARDSMTDAHNGMIVTNRLDRRIDDATDHILGPVNAEITLVEYGSYACSRCRAANERIAEVRARLGDRIRYVFRHYPTGEGDIGRRAADLVERSSSSKSFWDAHAMLMTRSSTLTEDDLKAVASKFGLSLEDPSEGTANDAKSRVDADIGSARASGVTITPTFFINGRRYDGPWDTTSLSEALVGTLGHRLQSAALDFSDWAPSAGILLLAATVLAVVLTNSGLGHEFLAFWEHHFGLTAGEAAFQMSLLHWISDGLLTIFFLVVGLEIKREFTVGHLADWRSAALPVAAAIGGMAVPAILYLTLLSAGAWSRGWGIPTATDTAFAISIIVMMGRRVPVALRVFLTTAAIVDDIGAIIVVAIFYSGTLNLGYLAGAVLVIAALAFLNRIRVYRASPYLLLGVLLWIAMYAGGLHPTMTGAILALFIPTRPPANLRALMVQADAILSAEAGRGDEQLRLGPSLPAMRSLDAIHDRLESPADRMLRYAGAPSNYVVLPLFALANAGVAITLGAFRGHEPLIAAIMLGLVVGKPLGLVSASLLAVRLGIATKPNDYSWRQLAGAGALAGIGFTMSLFISNQAFSTDGDLSATKIAILAASTVSAAIGIAILWQREKTRLVSDRLLVER